MDYSSLLNEAQLAAVSTTAQYVRVIAGAGSGKTRVLTYRISYLIGEKHINPWRILAITFTNKAANEMKARAGKIVPDQSAAIHISTFHGFCNYFLRFEHDAIGYPSGFSILDEEDQKSLVGNVAVALGFKKSDPVTKEALSFIREAKGKGKYPQDIRPGTMFGYGHPKDDLKFFEEYEKQKQAMWCLDFDDLLLQCLYILETYDEIRQKWQTRYDHILVDEFQDTNDIQYKLIQLLMSPTASLYVVGDPDQTIYTWRGANQDLILNFNKCFPGAQQIILDRNYRSTQTILDAANKLIAHNKKRIPKDLYTKEGTGAPIQVKQARDPAEEAKWVCNNIDHIVKENGGDYTQIAILYRSNYLSRPFEAELAARGVPYTLYGGQRFYERTEVKDVLAYFHLLVNPQDDISFERICNVPRRGLGSSSLDLLKKAARERGISEFQLISSDDLDTIGLKPSVAGSLKKMSTIMADTNQQLQENLEVYSSVLRKMVTDLGLYDFYAQNAEIDEDRVGNINSLFDDVIHFIDLNPTSSFAEYLQNVSLLSSGNKINGGNCLSLMTVHAAKGLEFPYVFIVGLSENVFPNSRACMESGESGLEEERRAAYVAFTRAKKELFLSCNSAYSHLTDSTLLPSRFFAEAGIKLPSPSAFSTWGRMGSPSARFGGGFRSSSNSLFDDGDNADPFAQSARPVQVEPEKPQHNDVGEWHVGDIAHHEKFGDGKVIQVISSTIIVVDFENAGRKTLQSTHPLLSRKVSKGGYA